jgi:hypothetical protein
MRRRQYRLHAFKSLLMQAGASLQTLFLMGMILDFSLTPFFEIPFLLHKNALLATRKPKKKIKRHRTNFQI